MAKTLRVTTIGGGTGTFAVITALKTLKTDISCIVAVSDSGGSTGRIRDEFGFGAVGDLRQSLAALASEQGQEWIQKLLLYRFSRGNDLKGHNLGNLILTALQDMTQSTTEALEIAERIFSLSGSVIPVTEQSVQLKINYADGSTLIGEHYLDEVSTDPETTKAPVSITGVQLVPDCTLNPIARHALLKSDLIVIGPGDYYGSLHATLAAPGIKQALGVSKAKIMYIINLMTRRTQTHGMTALDHLKGIEQTIGKKVDIILLNNSPIPKSVLTHYALEGEYPVVDDLSDEQGWVLKTKLASTTVVKKSENDVSYRSLLRHDSSKLRQTLRRILKTLA